MRNVLAITKALADPSRLRLLAALRGGERCVCQLIELLGLAGSTVSKHLSVLHQAGLVESRKKKRWVYYRLPEETASPPVRGALAWLESSLSGDATVADDRRRLTKILQENPSELCKRQCNR